MNKDSLKAQSSRSSSNADGPVLDAKRRKRLSCECHMAKDGDSASMKRAVERGFNSTRRDIRRILAVLETMASREG